MNFRKLITYLTMGTVAVMPFATAQNPTILQGSYISNVFGPSNFVKNPNAQTNVASVTVSSATVTRSTTTPLVATSEFNITTSTSTGYADWALRTFDAGMKNNNCEARFTYRGFTVGSTKAQILQGTNVVAELTLIGDANNPKQASINFPCGDLSAVTKFRLQQATASLTGTNEIGAVYVGLATNMANVAQAEEVGSYTVNGSSNCNWDTNSTSIANFTADADCNTGTVTGAADTSAGKIPGVKFNNLKPGKYMFVASHSMLKFGGVADSVYTNLTDGTTTSGVLLSYVATTADTYIPATHVLMTEYTTMTSPTVQVQGATSVATNTLRIPNTTSNYRFRITAYRFPSASELVVTPERQNVFGGVAWNAPTTDFTGTSGSYVVANTTNYGTGTYFGQATAAASSCGLTTNDIGFCMPVLMPGTYQITSNLIGYVNPTNAGDYCNYSIRVGGGTLSETNVADMLVRTGSATINNFSPLGTGIIKINSVQTNVRVSVKYKRTTATGTCGIRGDPTNLAYPSLQISPLDQPSNSALYVQGPVLGAQTGAAISAGYVGEVKHNQTSGCGSNATYQTGASITLTPGLWMASSTAFLITINKVTDLLTFVSPSSGTSTNWRNGGYNDAWFSNDTGTVGPYRSFITSPNIMIRFDGTNMWRFENNAWIDQTSSSGTLYAKNYRDLGAGTCSTFQSSITAIRLN